MHKIKHFTLILIIGLSFLFEGYQSNQKFFQDEIERINIEVELQGLRWKAGETSLSILSPEVRKLRLGSFIPLYEDPEKFVKVEKAAELPSFLDWRAKNGQNFMTSVKNQGDCGSCWAFSTLGSMEALYNIEKNLSKAQGFTFEKRPYHQEKNINFFQKMIKPAFQYPDLSEQDLVSCSGAGSCEGGRAWEAMEYIKNKGVVSEDCFPYTSNDDPCHRCANWRQRLSSILDWGWVTQSTVNKNAIKNALQDGPLNFWMEIYSDFYHYVSGVYRPTAGADYEGDHCIVLVGYNENENYWICKNSWGKEWGEDGYFKIEMGACETGMWVLKLWGVSVTSNPPILSNIGNQITKEGQDFTIQLEAFDPDYDLLNFNASPLPSGASLNASSGLFTWTPAYTQSGEYNIRFSVSDGLLEDFEEIKITVLNVKKGKGKF